MCRARFARPIMVEFVIVKSIPTRVNVVIPRKSYTTLVATDRERLGFTSESKWSGVVAADL